jgi:SOS-response transcriptional repressor LexA
VKRLTTRQTEVLAFIVDWDHDYPPTMREIQEGMALDHLTQVARVLDSLEKKRYIVRDPKKKRTLRVIRSAPPVFHV